MDIPKDPNNSEFNTETASAYGYQIKRITEISAVNSFFYELEHIATGARHIHISTDDSENTFSVAFKTVPTDSTGVAHILEHTALCGSEKFPVRDPFFSMIKRSLNTFMNAFTASDWTMYPFSTQNRKDFYNLMDVYMDAAFFPLLDPLGFKQEGHRLEIEGERLVYKGVVYNEMKGAMSSPDQIMGRSLLNALYPSTTYSHNSGGEPAVIPTLTHNQLKKFHQRHYHPSNAFFYTYGNLPLKDHLAFIQEKILKHFEKIDPGTVVPSHPRWDKPRQADYPYPFSKTEDPSKKYQICVAWLLADIQDTSEVLALSLLAEILLGNSASPLRKALIDSGLGSALSDGSGFETDMRDTMFACGLKDVDESAGQKIEAVIFDTLKTLADQGIEKELIESAIHQLEFHRKEKTNHPYPYGLKLLLSLSGTWFHGGDPVGVLNFDDDLERIREQALTGNFFENQIKKYFLDNPHRVLFRLVPDQALAQREIERETAELDRIKAGMGPHELTKIREDAESLEKLQESKEDLSVLPTLALEDIPPRVQTVPEATAQFAVPASCVSIYNQPTSGIFYLTAVAGISNVKKEQIPWIPFFCYAFDKMGTARHDYVEMARRIDLYTGGIGMSAHARTRYDDQGNCLPFITFGGKCLERNQEKLFEITDELFNQYDFSDQSRLKNLLLEYRSALESSVVRNGHQLAISLAARNFSMSRTLGETWNGIHQLKHIKNMTESLTDASLKTISRELTTLAKTVFSDNNLCFALIGEESSLTDASLLLKNGGWKLASENQEVMFESPSYAVAQDIPREGWMTESAVSFVASTFGTVRMTHEDSAALSVISKLLRSLYLHREIREKGGAYGGFAVYNSEDGLFGFASYRDPHIVSTLNVYDRALEFIRSGKYTDEDIKEAILQICSDIDKPDPPGPASRKAFYRKIVSLSDDARNRYKQKLLSLTREQVKEVAEKYFDKSAAEQSVAVISGEEKLRQANERMTEHPLSLYKI